MGLTSLISPSQHIYSSSRSISQLSPLQLCFFGSKAFLSCPTSSSSSSLGSKRRPAHLSLGVRCMAVAAEAETNKRSSFEIQTLTGWLLKQEQAGVIDAELTIVISSISMACKQIAALVQRASISNLTGIQGAVNVQGEDQKKLDVVSNEVCLYIWTLLLHTHTHMRMYVYQEKHYACSGNYISFRLWSFNANTF